MQNDPRTIVGPAVRRGQQLLMLAVLASVVLVLWIIRSPLHRLPLERDEGAYAIIAQLWTAEQIPYRDFFDHKPPLVYLVYRLSDYLPGRGGEPIRLLSTLYLLASGLALLGLGRHVVGRWPAVAALALFLAYGSSVRFQGITFNSEAVMLLPAILGCWLLVHGIERRRLRLLLLSGLCAGLAMLAKPVALLLLPAACLSLLLLPAWPWRVRLSGIGLLTLGVLLACAPFVAYFAAHGALPAVYQALLEYNRLYAEESRGQFDLDRLWGIWAPMLVLFLPGVAGLIVWLAQPAGRAPAGRAVALWGLALLASALVSMRSYPHYYVAALPALCLWAALLCARAGQLLARLLRSRAASALGAGALVVGLSLAPIREIWALRSLAPAEQIQAIYGTEGLNFFGPAIQVSDYLERHAPSDEPIFVWASEPEIYYLAQRRPALRFIYDYPLYRLEGALDETLAGLRRRPPRFIVSYTDVHPPGFGQLAVDHGYEYLTTIGKLDLYGRGVSAQEARPPERAGPAYGATVTLFNTDADRVMTLAQNARLEWMRHEISWSAVESSRGSYDWAALDDIVSRARLHQLKLLIAIADAPAWASAGGGLPETPQAFGDFIGQLALRYRGQINAYEIWPGANMASMNGGSAALERADRYAELLLEAGSRIKAVDRAAAVLIGAPATTAAGDDLAYCRWLYSYRDGIIRSVVDGQAVDLTHATHPPDERWPHSADSGAGASNHPGFYFRHVENVRELMVQSGLEQQVWITRFGWPASPGQEGGLSQEQQASHTLAALRRIQEHYPWVEVAFVWNLNYAAVAEPASPGASFSLLNPDWSPTPAFHMVQGFIGAVREQAQP